MHTCRMELGILLPNKQKLAQCIWVLCLQVYRVLHFLDTIQDISYTEEFHSCKIHHMETICLTNLVLLKNLQHLCCKLWPSMTSHVCHHILITFFESCEKAISRDVWDQLYSTLVRRGNVRVKFLPKKTI